MHLLLLLLLLSQNSLYFSKQAYTNLGTLTKYYYYYYESVIYKNKHVVKENVTSCCAHIQVTKEQNSNIISSKTFKYFHNALGLS